MRKLRDIERYTKTKIKRAEIPSANDVEEFKANTFLEKVKNTIEEGHLGKYIDYIENLLDEDFATIDIASALLKMALGEEKKEEVIEMQEEIGETGAEPGMVRLFINIGRNHKIQARDVIGAIAGETGIPGKVIGKIDIYEKFTFVEVPRENAREVLGIMKNNTIKGKKINIEPANAR